MKHEQAKEYTSELTFNEKELLNIIRENGNPKQAAQTAIDIIRLTLKQLESSQ